MVEGADSKAGLLCGWWYPNAALLQPALTIKDRHKCKRKPAEEQRNFALLTATDAIIADRLAQNLFTRMHHDEYMYFRFS